jgi:hypothetical protein
MATLHNALRAEEKVETFGGSLSSFCQEAMIAALRSVDHFYGYALFERSSSPKVELFSSEIVRELVAIAVEVRELETKRHHVDVTPDMAKKLEIIFRHLPETVSREGWSASLINAVSGACKDMACCHDKKQEPHPNLLYHAVLGSLLRLESIPPSIAYPMLRMSVQWGDLKKVAMAPADGQLSTPYWTSTLEIGRQVVGRLSEIFKELGAQKPYDPNKHQLSAAAVQRAVAIFAEDPLIAKLAAPS